MKMINDNVLIKELPRKTVLVGKFDLAPDKGEVVAVGPGAAYGYPAERPTVVKPGDKVVYVKGRGLEVELKGVKHYCVQERDVVAIFEENEL